MTGIITGGDYVVRNLVWRVWKQLAWSKLSKKLSEYQRWCNIWRWVCSLIMERGTQLQIRKINHRRSINDRSHQNENWSDVITQSLFWRKQLRLEAIPVRKELIVRKYRLGHVPVIETKVVCELTAGSGLITASSQRSVAVHPHMCILWCSCGAAGYGLSATRDLLKFAVFLSNKVIWNYYMVSVLVRCTLNTKRRHIYCCLDPVDVFLLRICLWLSTIFEVPKKMRLPAEDLKIQMTKVRLNVARYRW